MCLCTDATPKGGGRGMLSQALSAVGMGSTMGSTSGMGRTKSGMNKSKSGVTLDMMHSGNQEPDIWKVRRRRGLLRTA